MILSTLYVLAVLVGFAVAIPTAPKSCPSPVTYVDTFEDKPAPAVGVAVGPPIGIEHGIFYNGWSSGTATLGSIGGVIPTSQSTVALTSTANELPPNQTATLTRDYSGSTVTKFDLLEFYIGCAVYTANNVIGEAQGCAFTVTGYYADNTMAPSYAVVFGLPLVDTSVLAPVPMQRILLPLTFLQLRNVSIFLGATASGATDVAVYFLDNVKHTNYYC